MPSLRKLRTKLGHDQLSGTYKRVTMRNPLQLSMQTGRKIRCVRHYPDTLRQASVKDVLLSSAQEVQAAKTIANQGVMLIATVHGTQNHFCPWNSRCNAHRKPRCKGPQNRTLTFVVVVGVVVVVLVCGAGTVINIRVVERCQALANHIRRSCSWANTDEADQQFSHSSFLRHQDLHTIVVQIL